MKGSYGTYQSMKAAENKTKIHANSHTKMHKIIYMVYSQLVRWLGFVTFKTQALKPYRDEDQTCMEPPHPSNQP